MALKDLYPPGGERGKGHGEVLSQEVLDEHYAAIERAYEQAGLDFDHPSLTECPGLKSDAGDFQVTIAKAPDNGEILGAHSLATSPDEKRVNETDIFIWDGRFEQAPGRLRTPETRYLEDYHLTDEAVRGLTAFIGESVDAGQFVAVPTRNVLSLSQ